ncbi:hypothetical protein GOP47_0002402 [Adiantum capillus-veneris]|uniref:HMG box domain-containing protein n=1 Tax=Adiantum capillus-veneris TaxID=13818 RepID=A0A9D4ZP60_ADICA|nr:hypothetical protein GOP47_0002402 [Adiantum capillus-veneris]
MVSVEAPKAKKTSAYFSFCKQHRELTKARLKDAGQSVSAPALAKALSELWRSLSDEEKQRYKDPSPPCVSCVDLSLSSGSGGLEAQASKADQARTKKSRVRGSSDGNGDKVGAIPSFPSQVEVIEPANAEVEEQCMTDADVCTDEAEDAHGNEKGEGNGLPESGGMAFPLARVKRIIKLDKEIHVVAAEASSLIAHASQLFLEHLAMAAHASALKKKHKTIRIEDVKNAVKSESRIEEFLAEALNDVLHQGKEEDDSDSSDGADDAPDENVNVKGHSNKKSKTAKKPLLAPPAGTRKIAEFFSASNQSKIATLSLYCTGPPTKGDLGPKFASAEQL